MKPHDFRASAALAAVFSVRLLGLFILCPVFAAYAGTLAGANPYLIGEALGIYGPPLPTHSRLFTLWRISHIQAPDAAPDASCR